jgi:hypothetical protein
MSTVCEHFHYSRFLEVGHWLFDDARHGQEVFISLLFTQLNAYTKFNTNIYHHFAPACFDVCRTIFRETIALLAQKTISFCNVAIEF